MTSKTLNLDLLFAEQSSVNGRIHLTIIGHSVNGKTYRVKLSLPPSSAGHLGARLHAGFNELRTELERAQQRARGE